MGSQAQPLNQLKMPLFQSTLVDFSYKTGVLTPGGQERSR
jgi:hypothetical protein